MSPVTVHVLFFNQVVLHNNVTIVTFLGFSSFKSTRSLLFFALLSIYGMTITGNLLIVSLSLLSRSLHTPMYFFIAQLSLLDLMVATDIVPNLLQIVLYDGGSMSLAGCLIQFSFFAFVELSECLLLTVMSYDRYLAICKPLHYDSIVNKCFCIKSAVFIWSLGFALMMVYTITLCYLDYCGPNIIDHFFCDFEPIIKLSCSDTSWVYIETTITGFTGCIAPCFLIIISYIYIVVTILKIQSITGRQKAFTTCSSHLTVVSMFYGTLFIVYMLPTRDQLYTLRKILSLFYTVITPLLNSAIYTFRNQNFIEAFHKTQSKFFSSY